MSLVPAVSSLESTWGPALLDFAIRHKEELASGARKAARLYKARKRTPYKSKVRVSLKRKKARVGEPTSAGSAKKDLPYAQVSCVSKDTRTLYSEPLIATSQGTNINQRLRNSVNISGWKICGEIKNLTNAPLYVNIAVISPKGGLGTSSDIPTADFFRDFSSNDRSKDFGIANTSLDNHCLPINSDKYTIFKHTRARLVAEATGGDTVALQGMSYTNIDWWIPFKRQIRWDANLSYPESDQVYLVYWFDKFCTAGATAASTGAVTMSHKTVMYYREPCNC